MSREGSEYATLLRDAYLDEVRGAAYFGALAQEQPDGKRREKLETLQTVEARTVTTMDRLLGQVGLKVDGEQRPQARARAAHRPPAPRTGTSCIANLRATLPHELQKFEHLRDLSSRPDDPAMRALVNHARAIERFLELEAAGDEGEVAAAPHGPSAEARVITPEGHAWCGEQVSLDLHTLAAGTTEQIWAPPGRGSRARAARRRRRMGRRPRRPAFGVRGPRLAPSTSRPALPSRSPRGRRPSSPSSPRSMPASPSRATSRPSSAPAEIVVHDRGEPGWQRQVHDLVADAVPAERLLVGETFTPGGQWSSFPPHKHDGRDGEPALEEVYYFRCDRPDGFGLQGLYSASGEAEAVFVKHGTVVGIPGGYHPVCAAPGTHLYYLWALAGSERRLAMYEDPVHRCLHDA